MKFIQFSLPHALNNQEQIKRMEEPDGKIVLREVKSLDTNGKVLFGLVLRKFVENHPQIICGHIASLYDLP